MSKKGIIVGGGIGGLTAALCLKKFGWNVEIFEDASEFSEVGAGIQFSPNAMKVLKAISSGLAERVAAMGVAPERMAMHDGVTGFQLFSVPMTKRWHAPYINIYRPELMEVLLKELNGVPLHLGQKINVSALEDFKRTADLVVVASGVHSELVREHFYADTPIASGHVAYRCTLPNTLCHDLDIANASRVFVAEDRHAVTYKIKRRQEVLVNFVGIVEASPSHIKSLTVQWNGDNVKAQALDAFSNFSGGVPELLQRANSVQPWPLFYREPLPAWHNRNAVLLGDAAHAMLPTFAQGAAMAVEDAWVLAEELSGKHGVNNALSRYTGRRLPRVHAVHKQADRNLHLFHRKGLFNRLTAALGPFIAGALVPNVILSRFDAVYGEDVTAWTETSA